MCTLWTAKFRELRGILPQQSNRGVGVATTKSASVSPLDHVSHHGAYGISMC